MLCHHGLLVIIDQLLSRSSSVRLRISFLANSQRPNPTLHLARSSQVTNHGSRQTRNMARPSRCYSLDPPPSYRGSPKDDFSLEPTRPSTWLIAETDSSRTGTRNSCSANDGLKQFCPHTKFSANKKLSSCFNTGSFCIDSASFPVFRSQLFGEY